MGKFTSAVGLFGMIFVGLHSGSSMADANRCQTEARKVATSVLSAIANIHKTDVFFVPENGVQTSESERGMYEFVGYVGSKTNQVDLSVIVNSNCDPTEIEIVN